MMNRKGIVIGIVFCVQVFTLTGQLKIDSALILVDSIIDQMTLDQKVGQLFMIRSFSKNDPKQHVEIKRQIKKFHVGGICFFQGTPSKQASLVQEFQDISTLPLLIGIDAEWGLGMRFPDDAISFPRQLTIGAINDHQLIYQMGKVIGKHLALVGVNVNFAPVVDVNNNPKNPVINYRSFGEDRFNVASKAYAYAKGLEDSNILACVKHFPGHGDTDTDSHLDLPLISHSKSRLDSIELFPFQMLIQEKIPAIMVAHLQIPALDPRPNHPTTVSKKVVTDLLRTEMKFEGLIFTDAMEMKGITRYFSPGEADLEAFKAGNDVILLSANISEGFKKIKSAIESGEISHVRINASLRRILLAKYHLGLLNNPFVANDHLDSEINSLRANILKTRIYEKALTLVHNQDNLFPFIQLNNRSFGSVSLGSDYLNVFQKRILSYVDVNSLFLSKGSSDKAFHSAFDSLKEKDIVLISVHNMSWYSKNNFGIDSSQIKFIRKLSKHTKVLLTLFGSPYSLKYFTNIPNILVAYEDNPRSQDVAAQAIFGVTDITGKLPVTASPHFPSGMGIAMPGIKRIGFAIPESVGLNSDTLARIKYVVDQMITEKATPGCQILVAKDNRIVYWKSFGHHTYNNKKKVKSTDIYDIASITKIMASTLSMMHLQDLELFSLDDSVTLHIPEEDTTNKRSLIYEDLMAHVGSLKPWIPFYVNTLAGKQHPKPDKKYYRHEPSDSFNIYVTPNLYLRSDYRDTIWRKIFSSVLREKATYRYSDLAFYILNKTITNLTTHQVDEYAKKNFYDPLGLRYTLFNPLSHISKQQIVPTEKDDYFRMETIQGTVHDMGAAMLGGISGHAGLFSNALDLGVLMQMLLNKGFYGGIQYLNPKTVGYYTHRHWRSSRRGIGFDMKELNPGKNSNMSEKASRHTFGHMGFTGTAVFADPDYDLIYVFLSNRTYPTMENNKLGKSNYRSKIQTLLYNALTFEESRL